MRCKIRSSDCSTKKIRVAQDVMLCSWASTVEPSSSRSSTARRLVEQVHRLYVWGWRGPWANSGEPLKCHETTQCHILDHQNLLQDMSKNEGGNGIMHRGHQNATNNKWICQT